MPNPSPIGPSGVSRSRLPQYTGTIYSAAPGATTYYEVVGSAEVPAGATAVLMWLIAAASGGGNLLEFVDADNPLVQLAPPIVHPNGFPFASPAPEQGLLVCPPATGLALGCSAFVYVTIFYGYVIEYPDPEIT